MRLIDVDEFMGQYCSHCIYNSDECKRGYINCECARLFYVKTVPAVPVEELIALRDELYDTDAITMRGLAKLNQLMLNYRDCAVAAKRETMEMERENS